MQKPIYLFSISSHPHAKSINALDIKFLKPEIDFSKYDYLIITSKQVSEALAQYDKNEYIHMPSICVSKKSAEPYEALGGEVLACGTGYGDDLSAIIKQFPHAKRWLYLRAKVVASSFISTCQEEGYNIDEIVVYESKCSKDIQHIHVQEDATLVFASPSSIRCFLKTHTITPLNKVVVIGTTTAAAVPKGIKYHISKETTIESCMEIGLY
jgi:uroporphyrinogen-III synthase